MTQIKTFVVRAGLAISCVTVVAMVIFVHLKRISAVTGSEKVQSEAEIQKGSFSSCCVP